MIISPDATAIQDIVLVENTAKTIPPSSAFSGAGRLIYTEIDRVFLLCNACEHGACKIDYWSRDEDNITVCKPQSPCCPKCPQWVGSPCGESGGGNDEWRVESGESADIVPSQQLVVSNNVVLIEQDGEVFAIPI